MSCIICMNYALFLIAHCIEYLARMNDLSELIDTSCPVEVFGLLCKSITLVYLVVVIFLMCLLIHIWILLILIVGHSRFHLSTERSEKGKVIVIHIVYFTFVLHLIDQLVVVLSKCIGIRISVTLDLKPIYLLRRGVSWLILVKLLHRFAVQDSALSFIFQSDIRPRHDISCRKEGCEFSLWPCH